MGMGAIVSEGALVEKGAFVGAGAVVPPGARIPSGELWALRLNRPAAPRGELWTLIPLRTSPAREPRRTSISWIQMGEFLEDAAAVPLDKQRESSAVVVTQHL